MQDGPSNGWVPRRLGSCTCRQHKTIGRQGKDANVTMPMRRTKVQGSALQAAVRRSPEQCGRLPVGRVPVPRSVGRCVCHGKVHGDGAPLCLLGSFGWTKFLMWCHFIIAPMSAGSRQPGGAPSSGQTGVWSLQFPPGSGLQGAGAHCSHCVQAPCLLQVQLMWKAPPSLHVGCLHCIGNQKVQPGGLPVTHYTGQVR